MDVRTRHALQRDFARDLKEVHDYNLRVLDLKAKLAAAGVVTKEQVDKFDKDQEVARTKKRVDQEKAAERKAARSKSSDAKDGNGNRGNGRRRNANQSNGKRGNAKQGNGKHHRSKRPEDLDPSGINVAALKALNRGDAYARIRKIVEHSRLDDKERTIPKPDDQIFNFVTSKGRVSRLYLTAQTVKGLAEGQSAISSFMSHHGLSHCVLPAAVAVALAEVFPLWLRHLVGNEAAGLIEEPEAPRVD